METRETKNCPYCGEEILAVAKKCKHCGEWLPEDEESKETLHEEQPELTPVESEAIPHSETQELPKPKTLESPTVTPSVTVQEDTPTETPQMKAEQPRAGP
jgi:tRNA(Ile2) C34 agmatinyltransferase TiaS